MRPTHWIGVAVIAAAVAVLGARLQQKQDAMTPLAERYIKLVLALGQHDPDYVDAYYGPETWKKEAAAGKTPLSALDVAAHDLREHLRSLKLPDSADETTRLRREYLIRQVEALGARIAMLNGTHLDFDDESKALYDAVAPMHNESEFLDVLAQLERRLPGRGSLQQRYEVFRNQFVIPPDRVDAVFTAAIDACRRQTLEHINLPAGESFKVEYVKGKSWSGYNWYQGNYHSVIQVNTDLPIFIDRAIDLACHEGYPGHHVYNVLLEKNLVRDRGWQEFTIYALFSPQSLIAEGTANYGIEVAFPPARRLDLERRVLFPAAGLDPSRVEEYYAIQSLVDRLSYAGNEVARRYLNGEIDANAAAEWLQKYGLYSLPRAQQRIRFIDQYRSYVINYNLGKDMVERHIEIESGDPDDEAARWVSFERLISSPRLPSGLRK